MSHSVPDVSVDFTPAPIADPDLAYLLRLLFAEPAPEADHTNHPTPGLDAAFDRVDAHLRQFEAEGRIRALAKAVA